MTGCMNKKQISCLVAGMFCSAALIAFCIWAGVEGLFQKTKPDNLQTKNETAPVQSIKDRRGFIFSRSAEHPESVRIIASIATSKPVAVNPRNLTSANQQPRWARIENPDTTMATMASSKMESQRLRQRQFQPITEKSYFDLPDVRVWGPALIQQQSRRSDQVEESDRFKQPLNTKEWDADSFNMSRMLNTVSRLFGVDLDVQDPHIHASRDAISADRSSWVTLSYLSLSVFLLRQMDYLLKLQSEMQQRGRSLTNARNDLWTNNSLNLLFTEPGKTTDVERVINNDEKVDKPNDYLWAAHNIIKASKDSDRIDCLWSAYCVELDNRASLEGVTGKVARVNGIVLKMVTGWLSPSTAIIKLLTSSFNWNGMNCNQLFPRCKPDEAFNYLVQLATTAPSAK